MAGRRIALKLPFDDGKRRRIYLMRHGDAAYIGEDGSIARDPRLVPLSARGRTEAEAMARLLAGASFDRAVCSGLPRTVETAELVLAGRNLTLERVGALEEVRGGAPPDGRRVAPRELAYSIHAADEADGRFLHGETFEGLRERVLGAVDELLGDRHWTELLLVCHGGVNRVILTWALGVTLRAAPRMEQDSGCVNVIDVDQDTGGQVIRTLVRALNVTAADPAKHERRLTSLEQQARDFERFLLSR
jgi:probable phosphoglycerate mutase